MSFAEISPYFQEISAELGESSLTSVSGADAIAGSLRISWLPWTHRDDMFGVRDGGEGWIRTSVRLRGQIYSLLPLTTRPPLQKCRQARHVAAPQCGVNALHRRTCRLPPCSLRKPGALQFQNCPRQVTKLERVKGIARYRPLRLVRCNACPLSKDRVGI